MTLFSVTVKDVYFILNVTMWLLLSFVEMDKGGPSNWNVSNYINLTNITTRMDALKIMNWLNKDVIRRRCHRVALAIALASYAVMSLEPRLNMQNNILLG